MNREEKITPCLWFNGKADEAADLYCATLADTKIMARSPYVVEISASGHRITLLDGGPKYQPNASISFYYICETEKEFDIIWQSFNKEGNILVPTGKYPWSDKYGWVNDKYGVSWQVALGTVADVGQKITPCLAFTGKQFGRADEALNFYSSVFKLSQINAILYDVQNEKLVQHAQFSLMEQKFMVMDNEYAQNIEFSEGVSLTIHCESQDEIDYFWNSFTEEGEESMCGWLKDKFGVSWQILPDILDSIMNDPAKAGKAAEAFMMMRKLNIEQIIHATLK